MKGRDVWMPVAYQRIHLSLEDDSDRDYFWSWGYKAQSITRFRKQQFLNDLQEIAIKQNMSETQLNTFKLFMRQFETQI